MEFFMSIFGCTTNHTTPKYRCLIKMSKQIRLVYLRSNQEWFHPNSKYNDKDCYSHVLELKWMRYKRPQARSHLHSFRPPSLPGLPARTFVGTLPRWEPM